MVFNQKRELMSLISLVVGFSLTSCSGRAIVPESSALLGSNLRIEKSVFKNDVCFSPEGNCEVRLIEFLRVARESIDIAIFDLNNEKIAQEILTLSKKVKVRILVDRRQSKQPRSLVPMLKKAGVIIRVGKQSGIMHNKFTVVDSKLVQTGSFNYTNGAANKNNENQVYLDIHEVVGQYRDRFEKIWNEASK